MTTKKRTVSAGADVNPSRLVQIWHPEFVDTSKTQDEQSATTTYEAFVTVWQDKGWELVTEVTNVLGETVVIDPLAPEVLTEV